MGATPIPTLNQNPGGRFSVLNLTAATLIKSTYGVLYRMNVQVASTANSWVFNDANALVTAQTVTGISLAGTNPVVTFSTGGASNPFAVGNTIAFTGLGGATQLNSIATTVTAIGGVTTAWTVTLGNVLSSAISAWTSGGTGASYGAANQIYALPFASSALIVAGSVITIDWPCQNGILLSAVPTTGVCAVAYL